MMELLWLLILIPYAAIAMIAFGGATCAGQSVMWVDYIWAAVWPVYWLRPLYWKVRFAIVKRHFYGERHQYHYVTVFGVRTQRIDQWLLSAGEELSLWWQDYRDNLKKVDA